MSKKIYVGIRDEKTGQQTVTVRVVRSARQISLAKTLSPVESQKLRNHSPDGFNWGYGGSGPAQLALAILLDVCGAERAQALYQAFKGDVVARMPRQRWEVTSVEVEYWLGNASLGRDYFAAKFDGDKRQ